MKLFLISQVVNNSYDTYSSAVVIAKSAKDACTIHPGGEAWGVVRQDLRFNAWCALKDVQAKLLGAAKPGSKRGVVCASLNVG